MPATGQCGTISPQQYQGARLDNQRRWKWRRARSAMRRNEASDSEFPIRDERPGPRVQRAEEPRRCLPKNRSWVTRGVPSSAHAKEQVKRGKGGQQWYARPAKLFIGGKPCSFNTIGGIADTRRTFETRTKEQGLRGCQRRAMSQVVPEHHRKQVARPAEPHRMQKDAKGALL